LLSVNFHILISEDQKNKIIIYQYLTSRCRLDSADPGLVTD